MVCLDQISIVLDFYRVSGNVIRIVININDINSNFGIVVTDGSVVVGNFISVVTNDNGITSNLCSVVTDISIDVENFIIVVYNFKLFKKVKYCLCTFFAYSCLLNKQPKKTYI